MSLPLFEKSGRFYKGNLHSHSTESDGHLSPEAVCAVYREAGYDFLAITDHFLKAYDFPMTDTRPFRTDDFTTIIGAELHTGWTETDQLWHILAVGLPMDFAHPVEGESGPEIAQRAMQAGAFVAAAHPAWYTLTEADVVSLGDIHAIEVFNGVAYDHNDRADSWYMLDLMLARGRRYTACACDDAHFNPDKHDSQLGWVQVKAEEHSPEAILEALKVGDFYSSTGPQIHDIDVYPGDKIIVRCSPAERVYVIGSGWSSAYESGNGLINVELDISTFNSPYARIIVRDAKGGRAWSNPFWFE